MPDVLLIYPQTLFYDKELEMLEQRTLPLSLAYLGAVLTKNGFKVKVIDMAIENMSLQELGEIITKERPKVVGITCITLSYARALEVSDLVKKIDPSIIVVMGGPHPTVRPEETLHNDSVDVVVRREGEQSMLELVSHIIDGKGRFDEIRGISYRNGNRIVSNPERPFIKNLDELPFPVVHLFPLKKYYMLSISSGRGCPFRCIFCAAGHLSGHTYRFRSAESVVEEVRYLHDMPGVECVFFTDDTFTVKEDRTIKICSMMKREGLDISWVCESRVNTVSRHMLEKMESAGCVGIQFGVESGVQSILDSIRKGITLDQIKTAVKDALEVGIERVECSFMIGHPEDTVETVLQTIAFAKSLREIARNVKKGMVGTPLVTTVPLPGTYLYEFSKDLGVEILAKDWIDYTTDKVLFRTKHLDEKMIRDLYVRAKMALEGEIKSKGRADRI